MAGSDLIIRKLIERVSRVFLMQVMLVDVHGRGMPIKSQVNDGLCSDVLPFPVT